MTTAIRRRLEALEQQPGPQGEPLTLLVQFVRPGELDRELFTLRCLEGMSFDREADETRAAFIKRVASLARGADGGLVVLYASAAEPAA